MREPKYKRVLLKISGEALAGDAHRGLDFAVIGGVCDVIRQCVEAGVQVGIVVGGGNFWRGVKDGGGKMERTRADHMGMLATCINALAVADCLEQRGSFFLITPRSTRPVATVPRPVMVMVSSTAIRNGLSTSRSGVGM